jgi:hypothetical protein
MSLENCTGYPEMPKDSSECVKLLRQFNKWRRFDGEIDEEGPAMPHPKSIGIAIDMAIELIEQRDELQKKWDYYQEFCKAQGANGITDLLVQRDELLTALNDAVQIAKVAHEYWDSDQDSKVGKYLMALAGYLPGYSGLTDGIHKAISASKGGA